MHLDYTTMYLQGTCEGKIRTKKILTRLREPSFTETIEEPEFTEVWGRIKRMSEGRWPKKIFDGNREGLNENLRPAVMWIRQCPNMFTGICLECLDVWRHNEYVSF